MIIGSTMSMVKKLLARPVGCTEFQLHKSQIPLPQFFPHNKLVDFSEFKLLGLIRAARDQERKLALLDLLAKYRKGDVAIGWESGSKPVYTNVTKDTF